MKHYLKKIAFATALMALTGFTQAAEPIKIGVDGAFTGGSSFNGISMRNGIRLAASEINKAGGILGRQIQLVERDDKGKPEIGIANAQEFAGPEKVVAVVGFVNTGVSLASHKYLQDAKIPVINSVSTGSAITRQFMDQNENYIFSNAGNDSIQSSMMVHEAVINRGFKKIAILADNTKYGQGGLADIQSALSGRSVKPVIIERFNVGDLDMSEQLAKVKASGADVILTYGIGPELAGISNSMKKLGWKVPIIGSWTLSMASYIDNAGSFGEGARMPQTFIQEPTTPKRQEFIISYLRAFNPKHQRIDSPVSAAQGYDSIYILAAAIKQANSTSGPDIKAALEDLKDSVPGVIATYKKPFSAKDHEAIDESMMSFGEVKYQRVVYAYSADEKKIDDFKARK